MKRLISLFAMLFTLTVFISPNNHIIRESQYITKDKISTKKSVNIPITITENRIIIYSTTTQIYDYVVLDKKDYPSYTYFKLFVEDESYQYGTMYMKISKDFIHLDIVYTDVTLKYRIW
jgi:hypothetical protein